MGSQLRWLERTPDKREVDGSIPFEPTKSYFISLQHIEKYIDEMKKYQGKLEKTSSQSFRKKSKKPIDNKKTI